MKVENYLHSKLRSLQSLLYRCVRVTSEELILTAARAKIDALLVIRTTEEQRAVICLSWPVGAPGAEEFRYLRTKFGPIL